MNILRAGYVTHRVLNPETRCLEFSFQKKICKRCSHTSKRLNDRRSLVADEETNVNRATQEADAKARRELEKTWAPAAGLRGWFVVADHKTIGRRFIIT